jgi:hypothetical protein
MKLGCMASAVRSRMHKRLAGEEFAKNKKELSQLRIEFSKKLGRQEDKNIFTLPLSKTFEVQKDFSVKLQKFFCKLFQQCKDLLGAAPCDYVTILGGSLARFEAATYSDIEFGIQLNYDQTQEIDPVLIKNDVAGDSIVDPYFTSLIELLELSIVSLGETFDKHFSYRSLRHGFSLDEAGNVPHIIDGKLQLVGNLAEEINGLKLSKQSLQNGLLEFNKGNIIRCFILHQTCRLENSESASNVYNFFINKRNKYFVQQSGRKQFSVGKALAVHVLYDLNDKFKKKFYKKIKWSDLLYIHDYDIKFADNDKKFDQQLSKWKENPNPNSVLFIFSLKKQQCKAYLYHSIDKKVTDTVININSTFGKEMWTINETNQSFYDKNKLKILLNEHHLFDDYTLLMSVDIKQDLLLLPLYFINCLALYHGLTDCESTLDRLQHLVDGSFLAKPLASALRHLILQVLRWRIENHFLQGTCDDRWQWEPLTYNKDTEVYLFTTEQLWRLNIIYRLLQVVSDLADKWYQHVLSDGNNLKSPLLQLDNHLLSVFFPPKHLSTRSFAYSSSYKIDHERSLQLYAILQSFRNIDSSRCAKLLQELLDGMKLGINRITPTFSIELQQAFYQPILYLILALRLAYVTDLDERNYEPFNIIKHSCSKLSLSKDVENTFMELYKYFTNLNSSNDILLDRVYELQIVKSILDFMECKEECFMNDLKFSWTEFSSRIHQIFLQHSAKFQRTFSKSNMIIDKQIDQLTKEVADKNTAIDQLQQKIKQLETQMKQMALPELPGN